MLKIYTCSNLLTTDSSVRFLFCTSLGLKIMCTLPQKGLHSKTKTTVPTYVLDASGHVEFLTKL